VTTLVGVFVGGASRRMGGKPKGLLPARDGRESLVTRILRLATEALETPEFVLVGSANAYRELGLSAIEDDPTNVGPIGGLRTLLEAARSRGLESVLALSCDLPDVTAALIGRLARHAPGAAAVAPRIDGIWQPLFARYHVNRALAAVDVCLEAERHALKSVLARLDVEPLPLEAGEAGLLADWDEPADIRPR